jgi:hypothetical protein
MGLGEQEEQIPAVDANGELDPDDLPITLGD